MSIFQKKETEKYCEKKTQAKRVAHKWLKCCEIFQLILLGDKIQKKIIVQYNPEEALEKAQNDSKERKFDERVDIVIGYYFYSSIIPA